MLFCCAAFFLHFFRFFLLLAYAFWPIFALLLPYCCPMLAFFYILLASLLALLGLWALGYGRAGPTGGYGIAWGLKD